MNDPYDSGIGYHSRTNQIKDLLKEKSPKENDYTISVSQRNNYEFQFYIDFGTSIKIPHGETQGSTYAAAPRKSRHYRKYSVATNELTNTQQSHTDYVHDRFLEIRAYLNKFEVLQEAKVNNEQKPEKSPLIVEEKDANIFNDPNKFWVVDRFGKVVGIPIKINWKENNLKDEEVQYSKQWTIIGCFNCNNLRQCVSLKKKRLRRDNFDLDLTYITSNVIAMGYPADGFEGVYRNSQKSVSNFLLESHYTDNDIEDRSQFKVKIYNLCIEKSKQYNQEQMPKFILQNFPMADHNICGMKTIFNFCIDAHIFLANHQENGSLYASETKNSQTREKYAAIAIHCKAGKGRTGLMLISHLIFSEHDFAIKDNYPNNAIDFYNVMRTMNKKALTIPSQIRYVHYFYHFIEREIGRPYFLNSLKSYNMIQKKFQKIQNSSQRLAPFSVCVGPFDRQFEFTKFEMEIFQLASSDNNEIINVYRLSDVLTNFSSSSEVFRWAQDDKSRFYLILLFNSEYLSGSETFKLGQDFKIKIKVNGRQFFFWLNSESIKSRDMPEIYESSDFKITQSIRDDQLLQLMMPRGVQMKNHKHNKHIETQQVQEEVKFQLPTLNSNQFTIKRRADKIEEQIKQSNQVSMKFQAQGEDITNNIGNDISQFENPRINNDEDLINSTGGNLSPTIAVQHPMQKSQHADEIDAVQVEFDEAINLWDNFEAQVFQEQEKTMVELDKKLLRKNQVRRFYKVSLNKQELDKLEPKSLQEQNVSVILYDEI